nr:MAG TPA: protein of unknown function (DUF4972) [Caudoviricetes sp.]
MKKSPKIRRKKRYKSRKVLCLVLYFFVSVFFSGCDILYAGIRTSTM